MATHCFIPLLGKRIRVTQLDNCGVVVMTNKQLVTDGFISISLSSEIEDGTEVIQKLASGALCVNEKFSDSFKRFNVEIEFCGVNPSLLALVTNAVEYNDYAGDAAGFTVGEGVISKFFALELWTGLSGVNCSGSTAEASGYILLPFIQGGTIADVTFDGENAVNFSLQGAYTKGGNDWGAGPYNVLVSLVAGVNEVQTATITGTPAGGTFTLSFNGATTAPIAYNAIAGAVQTALQALSTVGAGNVTVTGGPGPATPYVITFTGALQKKNVNLITSVGNFTGGTAPAIAVVTTTAGVTNGAPLPTALDAYTHLLLIDTAIAPPPAACSPILISAGP